MLLEGYERYIEEQARCFGVSPALHPSDHLFGFLLNHQGFPDHASRISYYFQDGARSADKLHALLTEFGGKKRPTKLLEFASGYGCVTRHLVKDETFHINSCDIHPDAIQFLRNEMQVEATLSTECPELFNIHERYDVVFALSFFSHMPITTWSRWLVRLIQLAQNGGLVLFTTHGRKSKPLLGNPEVPASGFWFEPRSEQIDLPSEEYGLTITLPHFVTAIIKSIPFARLIAYREAYWWDHQDLYVLLNNGD